MISIIICSANQALLSNVCKNITDTVGVPFEILAIDNSAGTKGICEVYNTGASQAKYEILCFVHEDVIFQTMNWGQIVTQTFNSNPDIGLLGVAGSKYKTMAPSGWHGEGMRLDYVNVIQGHKRSNTPTFLYSRNPEGSRLTDVVTVDGVWLCTTKTVFSKIKFDQDLFKGFHGYDIDFSLAVFQHYRVAVTFEVLMLHLSEGSCDKVWLTENLKFHRKWRKHLPATTATLTKKQRYKIEKETFKMFIGNLISFNLPATWAYTELWNCYGYLNQWPKLFFQLHRHIFNKYRQINK